MASPGTDRLVKAECRFTWNNQLVENVLHFVHSIDAPNPANMTELAEFLVTRISTDWLLEMSNTVTFREVYVEEYAEGISQSVTETSGSVGSGGVQSMAGNNAFCLSLRTEFVGRSRRGRFYTVGMDETDQQAGVVTATYRNNWLTYMNEILNTVGEVGWQWVVASFWSGGVARETGLVTPIQAVTAVDDFCDSQRRRLQGRGQ